MKYTILIQGQINFRDESSKFERYLESTILALGNTSSTKIIVSTWENEKSYVDLLRKKYEGVEFILSRDPGDISDTIDGLEVKSNVNRLILSTLAGLEMIDDDDVVLKMRTDSYLTGLGWKGLYEKKQDIYRDAEYKLFKSPVLNVSTFIRNPESHLPFLYHPSDIALVGKCSDLKLLFDIPLADEGIFKLSKSSLISSHFSLCPEQYIFLTAIEKNKEILSVRPDFKTNFQFNKGEIEKSNKFLINNFVFYSPSQLDFRWPKHKKSYMCKGWSSIYDFNDWKYLRGLYYSEPYQVSQTKLLLKSVMIFFGKKYFFIRTKILRIRLVRKIAYYIFGRR